MREKKDRKRDIERERRKQRPLTLFITKHITDLSVFSERHIQYTT